MIPHLLLTPGEPAGIGPDITVMAAQKTFPAALTVIADPTLLMARAAQLKLPLKIQEATPQAAACPHIAGTLNVIPVTLRTPVIAGKTDPANAAYVIETLTLAATQCRHKTADAIVTGPVHKAILNDAGIPFSGHTEFFAEQAGVEKTVMLFVVDKLKVALATTHLPLNQVANHITHDSLTRTITILHHEMKQRFNIAAPRILICGLNPHAGENGYLGREEIDVITPALVKLRQSGMNLIGPLPADTLFTQHYLAHADAVLAMYHDQALPLVKYIGFGHAVNVTLGLPFIRTSVDHGTAFDMAGNGKADPGSLEAAINLAITLAVSNRH